jgi:tetrahydromethanopterin S-methyltransferase subunit G
LPHHIGILWREEINKRLQKVEDIVKGTEPLIKKEIDKRLREVEDKIKNMESKLRICIADTADF